MIRALTRYVPDSFASALAAVRPDPPIDVPLARAQHLRYCMALAEAGASVTTLRADEACPDCVFVEDTAVVLGGTALITRPGAATRRAELPPIASMLDAWLDVVHMEPPATLDGGDVMYVGDTVFIGRSARTNDAGIARLTELARGRGHRVVVVELPGGVLHLKCVCSPLWADAILLADETIPAATFAGIEVVRVPTTETYAANVVAIGDHVIVADGYPQTHDALARAGFRLHAVPVSEVQKADGSLTCQSIVFG